MGHLPSYDELGWAAVAARQLEQEQLEVYRSGTTVVSKSKRSAS